MNPKDVLQIADLYARRRGIELTTLGTYAANHGGFFERLKQGRVTIRRAEEVLRWLSANWPADLDWPEGIDRPEPARTQEAA